MHMKILTTPNKILNTKSDPVEKFDKKLKNILKDMEKTLNATFDPKGVGLSAPQVGIRKRFFIMRPESKSKLQIFINPEIVLEKDTLKEKEKKLLEGCLSIPNIWGKVERPDTVKIKFRNHEGEEITDTYKGFIASVIQHEIDHLNGILFTQRAMEQGEQLYRSYKNKKGEDEFEEIEI